MKLSGFVLALVCCGASASQADWEYTKWGMTPAQVASAAKNLTKKSSDLHPDSDGNVTKLVMPYKSGKFPFEAQFAFDAGDKLASVTLVLNDRFAGEDMGGMPGMDMAGGPCHDLLASVKAAYGPAQRGAGAHMQYNMEYWQDPKNKNNVKYTVLNQAGCYVQYSAIKPAGSH